MKRLAWLRRRLIAPQLEPFMVTGGLYALTSLYYTRSLPFQILGFLILVAVALYWSYSIRYGANLSWRDLKLTSKRPWLNAVLALLLAVFGWFYFSIYLSVTRGEPIRTGYGGSPAAVATIILVATAEELFFRGYLQNRLSRHHPLWRRALLAVVALALYKNVVHMWEGMPLTLHLELFLLGILHNILPSLWMEWSGSLVGPLLLHVIWDLLVYAPMETIPYWVI
jgi:membrane protease YdiL (CAAX protease family)